MVGLFQLDERPFRLNQKNLNCRFVFFYFGSADNLGQVIFSKDDTIKRQLAHPTEILLKSIENRHFLWTEPNCIFPLWGTFRTFPNQFEFLSSVFSVLLFDVINQQKVSTVGDLFLLMKFLSLCICGFHLVCRKFDSIVHKTTKRLGASDTRTVLARIFVNSLVLSACQERYN